MSFGVYFVYAECASTNCALMVDWFLQVCDAMGPAGCGCFTRNTPKYGPTAQTHCFLYPTVDCATPVKGAGSSYLYLKPNASQPAEEAAAAAGAPYTPPGGMAGFWPKNYQDKNQTKTSSDLTLAGCEQVRENAQRPTLLDVRADLTHVTIIIF